MKSQKSRKTAIKYAAPLLLCLLALCVLLSSKASAAEKTPGTIKITDFYYQPEMCSYYLAWEPVPGADSYRQIVFIKEDSNTSFFVQFGQSNYESSKCWRTFPAYCFTDPCGVLYDDLQNEFKITVCVDNKLGETIAEGETEPFASAFPQLAAPKNVRLDEAGTLSWSAVENAGTYFLVLFYNDNGSWKEYKKVFTKDTKYDFSDDMVVNYQFKAAVQAQSEYAYNAVPGKAVYSDSITYGRVNYVKVTMPEPLVGRQAIEYGKNAVTMSDAPVKSVDSVQWLCKNTPSGTWAPMKDSDTFTEGKEYAVTIRGTLKEGCSVTEYLTFTLNGPYAEDWGSDGDSLVLWYTWGKLTCKQQPSLNIIFPEPAYGNSRPDREAVSLLFPLSGSAMYYASENEFELDGFDWEWQWYDSEGTGVWSTMTEKDTFQCNALYRLTVSFNLYGNKLASGGTITINRNPVPAENITVSGNGQNYSVTNIWRTGTAINTVAIHSPTPAVGKPLPGPEDMTVFAYTDKGTAGDGVELWIQWQKKTQKSADYKDVTDAGAVFEEGCYYRCLYGFSRKEGYYFTENIGGVLNGIRYVNDAYPIFEDESSAVMLQEYDILTYSLTDVSRIFQWWNGRLTLSAAERSRFNVDGNSVTDLRDASAIFRALKP